MKAVILAAGKSSRFYPMTGLPHKSIYSILGKPIIEYTICAVKKSGISDIVIVVSPKSPIQELLGNGDRFGVSIKYAIQDTPLGMGNALLAAKKLLDDNFFLVNAHRVDFADFKEKMDEKSVPDTIVLLGKRENVLGKFGVVKVDDDCVKSLIEKPTSIDPESDIRVLGVYLLNASFLEFLENIQTEEYQLEKAIDKYAKEKCAKIAIVESESFSLKYSWDLLGIKNYLLKTIKCAISDKAEIAESAQIIGDVIVEAGAKILENAVIKNAFIGKNCIVGTNALIRDSSILECGSKVGANTEIKNVLLGENSSIHSGMIEDSVIAKNCKIGAGFCTSNVRIDRKNVLVGEEKIDTGLKNLGVVVGEDCRFGVDVTTMPGVLIGKNSTIGPSTTVFKNVPADSIFYTEFKKTVLKKKS